MELPVFLERVNSDLVRDLCDLLGHCLPSGRGGM